MKRNVMLSLLLLMTMLSLPQFARAEMQLNQFKTDSYKTIVTQYQGNSFLMVLWSVDCPPCIEELPALARFHGQNPKANIVMVSTDSRGQETDIQQLMNKHDLTDIQQWVFDDGFLQAIRFSIDPAWYGELPRSYFHHKNKRQAKSGRLDEEVLLAWIRAVTNGTAGL